jgi:hypothetical protein
MPGVLPRIVKMSGAAVACGLILVFGAGPAPAGSTATADVSVDIAVGTVPNETTPKLIPRGATTSASSLSFKAGMWLEDVGPNATESVTVHFELPAGLRWGSVTPSASQGCTSSASAAECTTPRSLDPSLPGNSAYFWEWDVVADAPGSYVFHAELVNSVPTDPNSSNNSSFVKVVVTSAVKASAVKVTPVHPKAGAVVSARVALSAQGSTVSRPSAVACSGHIGHPKLAGSGAATTGAAICRYRTPRSAAGKTLSGAVSLMANGTKITRRFAVRLR